MLLVLNKTYQMQAKGPVESQQTPSQEETKRGSSPSQKTPVPFQILQWCAEVNDAGL